MQLHEFMTAHRSEILEACGFELRNSQRSESLGGHAADFYDETLRAIRRDSGFRDSSSPLPASSDAAARFGAERENAGVPITQVPVVFAAISQAIGKTGEKYELTISAEEYKMLNGCLDAGVASSIENFWRRNKERERQLITEKVGFMSHELRNALGNASTAFRLLRGGGLDINGKTADVLARNLGLMEALVGQYLGSAQLDLGMPPALTPVQVSSVLSNLEASTIPDRGIALELYADESVYIAANELLLTSAIGNLVHNAVKFSPPGATIRLRLKSNDESAWIEVEDQCGGISLDDSARMFEPYVKQAHGNHSGTGLGLSIAKRAVEAMHGKLTVQDRPGYGCVFSARFPVLLV
ncbi:MAG TPA: HAMP domain-containing sensor histidine kinase [Polyangiaceae bacterium]|jgi:hypothetical protein|nr:HAMP domain-containing sensor histidine kinase [Polyangiaceae bacterium]